MERMNIAEYKKMKSIRENKFNAQRTRYKGDWYDSKKEACFAQQLDLGVRAGEIISWTRQTRFDLPGKADGKPRPVHRVDFLVFYPNEKYKFFEVKGRDLPMGKLKRDQVEAIYKIEIEVV